ncbi:clustered mitochondria protein homolog [Styela clava]
MSAHESGGLEVEPAQENHSKEVQNENNGGVKEESDDSAVHSGDDEIEKSSESPVIVMSRNGIANDAEKMPELTTATVSTNDNEKEEKKAVKIKDGNELVFIQDNLISITVTPPNAKSFEVQVSPQEIVQELHHLLIDHETTCQRTCFSLRLNGVKMDNFSELKSIPDLESGCEIKVVEEPYSLREVKVHLRHVRELLNSLEFEEAHLGAEGHSLSYLNIITQNDVSEEAAVKSESPSSTPNSPPSPSHVPSSSRSNSPNNNKKSNRNKSDSDSSEENGKPNSNNKIHRYKTLLSSLPKQLDPASYRPPEYVLPGVKEASLLQMHPENTLKVKSCVKVLTMSLWNPPPQNRKLHGDLMYLYVITIEDKHFHITASSRGFYVNKSDLTTFDPKPETFSPPFHSLIDLLMDISPGFRINFPILNKVRCNRHIFERVGTPFQIHAWTAPQQNHQVNHVHAEDFLSTRTSVEETIPGQSTRDWNEELAATRELPKTTLPERLLRERAMFKAHCDFVAAATRGAVMVIDGNIMPINPGEDRTMQMFIWNNIFFSLGFDVKDHYKDLGGNYAAFYAPLADLNGLRAYQAVDAEGLHLLGTVVIDYRGYRITAQSIIPGILEREQEQSIIHGSIDFGKTVITNKEYVELIDKVAKPLRQLKHSITSGEGEASKVVEIQTSVECKGITGNDGRRYLLDLLRTFPPDVNFLKHDDDDEPEQLLPNCVKLGFPKKHRHQLATLRPELVEAFAEQKYIEFMQSCAAQIFALRSLPADAVGEAQKAFQAAIQGATNKTDSKSTSTTDTNNVPQPSASCDQTKSAGQLHRAVVREAARKAGSCTDSEFDLRFNTDLFTRGIKHADAAEDIKNQKDLIKEAAEFLVSNQIPTFIRDCAQQTVLPVDGPSMIDAMHERGISTRYLGKIVQLLPESSQLVYIKRICVTELYSRCIRHIFRSYLQSASQTYLCASIVHFLNCLFSSCKSNPNVLDHESKKKRRNRRMKDVKSDWNKLTSQSLWTQISEEAKQYYDYTSELKSVEEIFEKHEIQRVALLRNFCLKNGIQLLIRDYDFESKHKPTFTEDDILDVYPVVKHVAPRASDAYHFYASGQVKIQQGALKQAIEYISESLSLFNNVYGVMHMEIASCYRSIARLQYISGDHPEAVSNQQKALIMFERILGIDHATTMFAYVNLAIYCFANSQIQSSLKLLYRAKYLLNVMYGDDHPDMAQINSTIGLVLHGLQEYDLSLTYLTDALRINVLGGKQNLKTAVSYHLVARAYSCKGNFRQALHNEKQTYKLYQALLGDDHDKTKESEEFLRHLTQQAVSLQRTMNEIYQKGSKAAIPPLQIMPPSISSVVDLINAINGIVRMVPAETNVKIPEPSKPIKDVTDVDTEKEK